MNEHPLKKTLRHLAEEEFPPGTDMWPEIQQAMERTNPKRNEMAIRFSNFTRAVAFGAMLVLLTLGLVWVLSSASAQPAKVTAENTPSSELPQLVATSTPVPVPTVTLVPTQPEVSATIHPTPLTYIVQEGDTCLLIATIYNVSVQSIINMNGLDANCIPIVGQKLLIPQTADTISNSHPPTPGTPLLSMDSDSDTIRQQLIDSQLNWSSVFIDAITTQIDGDTTSLERVQIWYVDPDKSRQVYDNDNDNLADTIVFTNNALQTIFDLKNGEQTSQVLDHVGPPPLSILNPGTSFALNNGMHTSGGSFQPISTDTIAGREALIVEWADDASVPKDRLWIDVYTGIVLKWENLREGYIGTIDGEEYVMNAAIEVLEIYYEGDFSNMFNPYAPSEPVYMEYSDIPTDQIPAFVPTPGNPDTSLQYGEIYLMTQDRQTLILHFPASCLITGMPCPQPEFVQGVPGSTPYFPFIWSPDYTKMLHGSSNSTAQTWVFDRSSQDWTKFVDALFAPVWAPDGQWVVGTKGQNVEALSNSLFVVSANGKLWQEIMADQPGIKYPLAWLDENNILFQNSLDSEKSAEDGALYDELQVYDLLSSKVMVVAKIPRDGNEVTMTLPSLSPDRSKIAYTLNRIADGTSKVVIIHFMGDKETSFEYTSGLVSWSPDGEWLIHNSPKDGPCTLTLISLDGKDANTIFIGDREGICTFVWSPDGQYLLIPTLAKIGIPRLYIISMLTGETRLIELPDVGVEVWWPVASWVP